MHSMTRRMTALAATAALGATVLVVPAVASAKSYKVNFKGVPGSGKQVGTKINGAYKGKPIGTCKMTGTLVIPVSKQVLKCKGGSFHLDATSTSGASNDVVGKWKMSKGTGKYKGIKGTGKFSGTISEGVFTYTGTAKY